MKEKITFGEICAVIITYNPDVDFPEILKLICRQVPQTFIVDNNSSSSSQEMLRHLPSDMNINIIQNNHNTGIAHALNQGIQFAKKNGFHWVLTMDQDSRVKCNIVERLLDILHELPPNIRIGTIGVNYLDQYDRPFLKENANPLIPYIEQTSVITSGSLLPIDAFDDLGGFCEELFIDQVDHDFCIRLRKKGYAVLMAKDPLMTQSIGDKVKHQILGISFYSSNHRALRRYYMTRNRIVLAKRYFLIEPLFVMKEFYKLLCDVLLILLFENNKSQKMHAFFLGLFDGLRGRLGKINNEDLSSNVHL